MKRIIIALILVPVNMALYAQAGINTTVPQQRLHVSGATSSTQVGTSGIYLVQPTMRIDGLNNANNSVSKGSTSLVQAVDVTQNGDLILTPNAPIPLFYTNPGTDALPSSDTITMHSIAADTTAVPATLGTYSFNLNQTSLVHFLASISSAVYDTLGKVLTDTKNRICFTVFRFTSVPAGSGITTNLSFGVDSYTYINTQATLTGVSGNMYSEPDAYVVLPPGSYTVVILGETYGAYFPFRAVFGLANNDMVSIVATPL